MLRDELNNNPFGVPTDYFDRLPSRVQERCAAKADKKSVWRTALKPQLGFVAGLGALALVAYGGFSLINKSSNTIDSFVVTQGGVHTASSNNSSYTQFTNNASPFAFASSKNANVDAEKTIQQEMNNAALNYLAVENISSDDILELE